MLVHQDNHMMILFLKTDKADNLTKLIETVICQIESTMSLWFEA